MTTCQETFPDAVMMLGEWVDGHPEHPVMFDFANSFLAFCIKHMLFIGLSQGNIVLITNVLHS